MAIKRSFDDALLALECGCIVPIAKDSLIVSEFKKLGDRVSVQCHRHNSYTPITDIVELG